MSKHNTFSKKFKRQFLSINNKIENYFNDLRYFILNFKKSKFSNNNKVILVSGVLIILVFSYFLLPTFYNKELVQSEIKNQIQKKYNVKIKFNEPIQYGLLPKPHFVAKNLSIIRNGREIAVVGNLKLITSINKLFSFNKTNLKDLIFKNVDFNIYKNDLSFFYDLLKIEPNENKIIFKNSNIFFKNSNDEVLFINKIKNIEFFYDSNNLQNTLLSKNEIFKIPFKLSVKNDKFNKKIFSKFESSKIRLNIENEIDYDGKDIEGFLDILFVNKDTSLNYKIRKNSLDFVSKNNNTYNGTLDFKPFYLYANFNYDGLSTKNVLNDDSILIDLIKSEILNSKNLNSNINFTVKDITNIDELNNLNLKIEIQQGELFFSGSSIMWKDSLKISLNESLLDHDEKEINLNGKVLLEFYDLKKFYQTFQVKKTDRKDIKQIQIDFVYNFMNKNISFDNVRVDNKINNDLQNFLDIFNSNKNRVFNKITFKNFINDFFYNYEG